MKAKIPWTGSRTASAVIASISLLLTLYGVLLFTGGLSTIQRADATKTPEDWSVFGFFQQLAGFGLIVIGGVLTLLFTGLYISTSRRLRRRQQVPKGQ